MYTWAQNSRGHTRYRFDFWDLDVSWGLKRDEIGEMHENWAVSYTHLDVYQSQLQAGV